jgi:hypothetical protein
MARGRIEQLERAKGGTSPSPARCARPKGRFPRLAFSLRSRRRTRAHAPPDRAQANPLAPRRTGGHHRGRPSAWNPRTAVVAPQSTHARFWRTTTILQNEQPPPTAPAPALGITRHISELLPTTRASFG